MFQLLAEKPLSSSVPFPNSSEKKIILVQFVSVNWIQLHPGWQGHYLEI